MKEKIKVIISNDQKKVKIPTGIRMLIRRCCNATLVMEKFHDSAEISVRFVDNEEIHRLNKQFRDVDSATDVLSFPLGKVEEDGTANYDENPETGAKVLGDIVISVERAEEQAKEFEHSLQREMAFLTVHSMLHLLGYDHVNGGLEAVRMREKEETVLVKLVLPGSNAYTMDE